MADTFTTPPSSGVPHAVIGDAIAPSDAAAHADRVAAETLIRTTIQAMANGATVRDVDGLVQRNAGAVTMADVRAGRLGSNVLGDIISTVEQAKGNGAFNWSAATPQQISAYLASRGITPGGSIEGSRSNSAQLERGSGGDRVTSETYKNALSSSESAVFGSLAKTYGVEAARSAITFAKELGTTPDMARKFVKLDTETRADVKHFVEDIRNDPSLTDDQKKEKIAKFRKEHPKAAKVLTGDDFVKILRENRRHRVELKGRQAQVHEASQDDRVALDNALGVGQQIHAQHRNDVARAEAKPNITTTAHDEFLASADDPPSAKVADASAATATPAVTPAKAPKPAQVAQSDKPPAAAPASSSTLIGAAAAQPKAPATKVAQASQQGPKLS